MTLAEKKHNIVNENRIVNENYIVNEWAVIKKSKWRPARQGKEKVGVYLTKTFNFELN